MKTKWLILLLFCVQFFSGCELFRIYVPVYYENNAEYDIYCSFTDENVKYYNNYPDTTFSLKLSFHTMFSIDGQSSRELNWPIRRSIEDLMKYNFRDTIAIFFFHTDTITKYWNDWEPIERDYKVLKRYDLSIQDIDMLRDERGMLHIPYPPTEAMRNMKMYPPYEAFISQ